MKKITALLLALLFALSLAACGTEPAPAEKEPEPASAASMVNPMVAYDELSDITEPTGAKFCHPGVMGVSDEKFFLIGDTVADYRFTVGGTEYTWRFSAKTDEDISGVWFSDVTAFDGKLEKTELQYVGEGSVHVARWVNDEGQYTLSCTDENKTADDFSAIAQELQTLTKAR